MTFGYDGEPIDALEWSLLFGDTDARQVAMTTVGDVDVCTDWIGLDYGFGETPAPLVYETMVFGGDHDGELWRYPNRDAALAGHDQVVALVSEGAQYPRSGADGRMGTG